MTAAIPTLAVGIDTGGTYTDAVLLDPATRRVLATAKALTTRGNLVIGVSEALRSVLAAAEYTLGGEDAGNVAALVGSVSVSTTLATNAIVEGHGASVGVALIGFDEAMQKRTGIDRAVPDAIMCRFDGGHRFDGSEDSTLDESSLLAFIDDVRARVAGFAVASAFSVRNPAHELRARMIIEERTDLPVSISSDFASELDAPRRALTAVLNARIVGRITALIDAVRESMRTAGIDAPLHIVKGDGSLALGEVMARRPIETILSGPAASVIGARFLSGREDFVIADIGGTTTDVAVVENGWPTIDRRGAEVGGTRTMVRAIDMRTYGLGGDSLVDLDPDGEVVLESRRVVPVSLLADRYPELIRTLTMQLAHVDHVPYAGRFLLHPFGTNRESDARHRDVLSPRDRDLLARVGPTPIPLHEISTGPVAARSIDRLVRTGVLQMSAFTPSDASHVLGHQAQWSTQASVLAACLLLRWRQMVDVAKDHHGPAQNLSYRVLEAVTVKSGRLVLSSLTGQPIEESDRYARAALTGTSLGRVKVQLAPTVPIVAVGGPAPIYYPALADRLGAEVVLLEHGAVANAVGAAIATVRARAVVEITSVGLGSYVMHAGADPVPIANPSEALERAEREARRIAQTRANQFSGIEKKRAIDVRVERVDIPNADGDVGLIAATITAECVE